MLYVRNHDRTEQDLKDYWMTYSCLRADLSNYAAANILHNQRQHWVVIVCSVYVSYITLYAPSDISDMFCCLCEMTHFEFLIQVTATLLRRNVSLHLSVHGYVDSDDARLENFCFLSELMLNLPTPVD